MITPATVLLAPGPSFMPQSKAMSAMMILFERGTLDQKIIAKTYFATISDTIACDEMNLVVST